MINNVVKEILKKYDLKAQEILPSEKGYRNISYPIVLKNGSKINLILYKNEKGILERIERTNLVSDYLASKGFPTRKSLGKIIRVKTSDKKRFVCIYNYLSGNTIPWEGYTMEHIKLLGKTMSDMHHTLSSKFEVRSLKFLPDAIEELSNVELRMSNYFHSNDVVVAMKEKLMLEFNYNVLENFKKLFLQLKELPDKQVLHLDFVRSNILFDTSASKYEGGTSTCRLHISGVLDFEKTAYGPKIIDIARTLAFLIVDCKYKTEQKVRKYFLHSGYNKRGKCHWNEGATSSSRRHLQSLTAFFWLHDFYKFLLHNPYESLKDNEHFVRTRDLLIREKIIRTV
jgi:Ser/Thr protein kinase RdoA (MazF antagonist)